MASNSVLDVAFDSGHKSLLLTADLRTGWARHRKTYCFSESARFYLNPTSDIRAEVSFFPRPGSLSSLHREPPFPTEWVGERDGLAASLVNDKLAVRLHLWDQALRPRTGLWWALTKYSGKPMIHYQVDWIRPREGSPTTVDEGSQRYWITYFELQVLVVFDPPPAASPAELSAWHGAFRR